MTLYDCATVRETRAVHGPSRAAVLDPTFRSGRGAWLVSANEPRFTGVLTEEALAVVEVGLSHFSENPRERGSPCGACRVRRPTRPKGRA